MAWFLRRTQSSTAIFAPRALSMSSIFAVGIGVALVGAPKPVNAAPSATPTAPSVSSPAMTAAVPTMPASVAGVIGVPRGRIAYIKKGDVYVVNVDGTGGSLVCQSANAFGRSSWGPGNKEIVFARQGVVDIKNPDGLGGKHKIYDLFKVILDSASVNNTWWLRITENFGSRSPEWSKDGKRIFFTHDLVANTVGALYPNYQISSVDPNGDGLQHHRPDYQQIEFMCMNPTVSPTGQVAYNIFYDQHPQGIIVTDPANPTPSFAQVKDLTAGSRLPYSPSWSPDGKWIAYTLNDMSKNALYVNTPDFKENYLIYRPKTGRSITGFPVAWSPDSKWVSFGIDDGTIWICDITGKQAKIIVGAGENSAPSWSR